MSVILFAVVAPLLANITDSIERRVETARIARRMPRRARQYKFN